MPDEIRWPRRFKNPNNDATYEVREDGSRWYWESRLGQGWIYSSTPLAWFEAHYIETFSHHPPVDPVVPYFDSRGLRVGLVWPRSTGGAK